MKSLYDVVMERLWLLALVAVVGAVAGAVAAWLMVPTYRAEVLLAPRGAGTGLTGTGNEGALGGLAALTGFSLGSRGEDEEYFAFLQGASFKLRFIESHDLTPILIPGSGQPGSTVGNPDVPDRRVATSQDALRVFNSKVIGIARDKMSGLVRVTVDWTDPQLAARWAKDYVRQANRELAERDAREMDRQIEFIQRRLENTTQLELRQSLLRVLEGQLKARMMVDGNDDYAFRTIDEPIVPDRDKPIRPRTLSMIAGSGAFSAAMAVLLLVLRSGWLMRSTGGTAQNRESQG